MKRKDFLNRVEEVKFTEGALRLLKEKLNETGSLDIKDSYIYRELKEKLTTLKDNLKKDCEIVSVSFRIGYRSYYENVYKVGKSYFNSYFEVMTQKNGYRSVVEIPAITEKMKEEMLSDSYYY